MDTEKILLEIHGNVASTQADVKHLSVQFDKLDSKVVTLHDRVDRHGKMFAYASGSVAVILIAIKLYWAKMRTYLAG